jgi:catechol 2,3-dioxygenase-like lactoylglutathione lyase family enzyme
MLIVTAAALAVAAAAAAQTPAPRNMPTAKLTAPPANLLPSRIGGSVIYVQNLEAMRDWYVTMFGLKVVSIYAREGKPFEYILRAGDDPNSAYMGVMFSGSRPVGYNNNSRVGIPVPDPKALADHFAKQGVYVREASPGAAYFVVDPEGNQVEIFRLSAPAPAR